VCESSLGPDLVQHRIECARQRDQFLKRQVRPPFPSERIHHLWEPRSLRITGRHVVSLWSQSALVSTITRGTNGRDGVEIVQNALDFYADCRTGGPIALLAQRPLPPTRVISTFSPCGKERKAADESTHRGLIPARGHSHDDDWDASPVELRPFGRRTRTQLKLKPILNLRSQRQKRRAVEMAGLWKAWKAKSRFPTFPPPRVPLLNSQNKPIQTQRSGSCLRQHRGASLRISPRHLSIR
jgi:hypothetical protein